MTDGKQGFRTVLEKHFGTLVATPVVQKWHTSALICFADIVVEQQLILCFYVRLTAFEGFGKMSFLLTLWKSRQGGWKHKQGSVENLAALFKKKKKEGEKKGGKEEWLSLESWMALNLWCCGHHKSPWLAQLGNTLWATFGSSLALPPSPQTTQQ